MSVIGRMYGLRYLRMNGRSGASWAAVVGRLRSPAHAQVLPERKDAVEGPVIHHGDRRAAAFVNAFNDLLEQVVPFGGSRGVAQALSHIPHRPLMQTGPVYTREEEAFRNGSPLRLHQKQGAVSHIF